MIEFTFLGANGSLQEKGSGNTSLIVGDGCFSVMIDVSVNLFAAVEADVDALILTHEHIDHIYALPSLLHQMWLSGRKKPLCIYCNSGISGLVNGLIDIFSLRQKKGIFEIKTDFCRSFSIGSLDFEMFCTEHTSNSRGVVVRQDLLKLVYTGDTPPIENPPESLYGADVLIHEANSVTEKKKPDHSSGLDAALLAVKTGAKKLVLCHLPKGDGEKEKILTEASSVFKDVCLPEVMKRYRIG